ncbi:MAG: sugar phosphate isomerase/epimerase [Acidimicrobiia bacterium]|nr:sugar phosphate isomerase/epimerase [Acidimicrobiia bacterium]
MTRREMMAAMAAALPLAAAPRSKMGIATTSYMTVWRPRDTYEFLEHCHSIGAGGIQSSLTSMEPAYISKVRSRAEQLGMYIELMGPLPRAGTEQFEAVLRASKEVGAICVRSACLGGRRYETFNSLADWKKFVADSHAAIERALPLLEKHKVKMALENHKDWTTEEFLKLLAKFKSEYLGVCLDTGNNVALLDDPLEMTEALAPYTFSTHIKDMGVALYKDGFLLSEVPLGEGFLDLKKIVAVVQKAQPQVKMSLEMITRNPLQVPCLTEKYWLTFEGREGKHLARTLAMVREKEKSQPLPSIDGLDKEAQQRWEADNVKQCLNYARQHLGL